MSMRHKNISDEEIHSRINGIVVDSQGLKGTELVTKLVVQLANEEKGIDSGRILDILDDMERKGDLVIVRYVLASLNYRVKMFVLPRGTQMDYENGCMVIK